MPGDPAIADDRVGASPAATAADAAAMIARFEHGAWALAALARVVRSASIDGESVTLASAEDVSAARVLVAAGLFTHTGDADVFRLTPGLGALLTRLGPATQAEATTSTLRQIATVIGAAPRATSDGGGWGANDDETLLAQGRASALGGQMLATMVVATLAGLSERFEHGGQFLDVGTGVGELGSAFAAARPDATVVGLDVMPRAVELARRTIASRDLGDRFEVRLQSVEDLDETERYDLAWIPAPFIPHAVFERALVNLRRALAPGGWLVVGAGRLEGDDLGVAVTRWQTHLIGGTALSADDASALLASTGFTDVTALAAPPGAPALYAARRPPNGAAARAG